MSKEENKNEIEYTNIKVDKDVPIPPKRSSAQIENDFENA